jgi:hypothetical protein
VKELSTEPFDVASRASNAGTISPGEKARMAKSPSVASPTIRKKVLAAP